MADESKIDWREQYWQALFEADPDRVLMRIEAANEAIRWRICELWELGSVDIRERSQLDSAAYFLGLLRSIAQKKQEADGLFCSPFDSGKQPS
jgi:hypothetical protein